MQKDKISLRAFDGDAWFFLGICLTASLIAISLLVGYGIGPAPMPKSIVLAFNSLILIALVAALLCGFAQQKSWRFYMTCSISLSLSFLLLLVVLGVEDQTTLNIEDRLFYASFLAASFLLVVYDLFMTILIRQKKSQKHLQKIDLCLRLINGSLIMASGLCFISYLTIGINALQMLMTIFGVIIGAAFAITKFIQPNEGE